MLAMASKANRLFGRLPFVDKAVAVAACAAVAAASACSNPPLELRAAPPEHAYADSLILSLDDVRQITKFEGLETYSYADRHQPLRPIANAPGPCQAVGSTELTYAPGWKEFRAVTYSGTTDDLRPGGIAPINEVSNAVGIYPDAGAARRALAQLQSVLSACASLHDAGYDFTLAKPDPSTLRLSSAGWSHVYRAKSSVLVSVGVLGIEPTEQLANTVVQTITDRIK